MTLVWDYANRLSSDTQDIKDGTFPPHTVNYTYGADGKVVDMDVDGSTNYDFLFNYDGMGRLESCSTFSTAAPITSITTTKHQM